MAELDLTEAIEVATAAWLSDMGTWRSAEGRVEAVLIAVTPIIERQVREMVAAALAFTDAEWREFQAIPDQGYSHRAWLCARSRRIARGAS